MLRVFHNEKKGTTTALVEHCKADAFTKVLNYYMSHHVDHSLTDVDTGEYLEAFPRYKHSLMHETYSGTVKVREGDKFNAKEGEKLAVKKALDNQKKAVARAIKRWQVAMIKDVINVSPETFEDALETARRDISR